MCILNFAVKRYFAVKTNFHLTVLTAGRKMFKHQPARGKLRWRRFQLLFCLNSTTEKERNTGREKAKLGTPLMESASYWELTSLIPDLDMNRF